MRARIKQDTRSQRPTKVLRVGIIQNGRIIEERLLRPREVVSVGQKHKNTFSIASESFPGTTRLFEWTAGGYVLNLLPAMRGRVSIGGTAHDVTTLQASGQAKKTSTGIQVTLERSARGKVVLGDVTILFQFVTAPSLDAMPRLPLDMRGGLLHFIDSAIGLRGGVLMAMLLSLVVQGGGVLFLVLRTPPPPRAATLEIPNAFRQVWSEPEPMEVAIAEPAGDVPTAEDGVPTADAAPDDATTQEDAIADRGDTRHEDSDSDAPLTTTPSETVLRDIGRARAREGTALAALYTGGDDEGPNLGLDTTNTWSSRRADEAMARQVAVGEQGSDVIVMNGAFVPTNDSDVARQRMEVPSQPSELLTQGPADEPERDQAPLIPTAIVDLDDHSTAGTGHLDDDGVRRVLRRRRREIVRCYERGLAGDPGLHGRVGIQFTINERGRVADVRLRENDLGNQVGNCITGSVRRWRFDEPQGGDVTVRTPYVFTSGE